MNEIVIENQSLQTGSERNHEHKLKISALDNGTPEV